MGVLEYFDFPDLPFLCSLALVEVCAGMKHTWTDSHTDRNVQTSNRVRYHSSVLASLTFFF